MAFDAGVTNKMPEFLAKFSLGQVPTFQSAGASTEWEAQAAADVRRLLDHYTGGSGPRALFVKADAEGPRLADIVIGGTVFILYFAYMDAEMPEDYPRQYWI
ncbi:glutathione S-transferase [Apiospora phragmitis]|uniref:Glutathione S-transferase n=1 Tax=Apiospora phragmitis TaxID=2905665 RepID=A0ABR1W983_9PEZI